MKYLISTNQAIGSSHPVIMIGDNREVTWSAKVVN